MPDPSSGSPHDPYVPPRADVQRAMHVARAPGRALAALYAASLVGQPLAWAALDRGPVWVRTPAAWASSALGWATVALVMVWLYAAWKGIPQSHRGTVSPRRAALSLLIPFYNAYWALAVNLALCDTLDGILARRRDGRRAPRTLAMVAWGVWIASWVVAVALIMAHRPTAVFTDLRLVVTGGLWLAYMLRCDAVRDAVAGLGDDDAALPRPRLSKLQQERGPGVLAAIGFFVLIIVAFFAIWQFLQPGERIPQDGAT
jgi:hypothetical protein